MKGVVVTLVAIAVLVGVAFGAVRTAQAVTAPHPAVPQTQNPGGGDDDGSDYNGQ